MDSFNSCAVVDGNTEAGLDDPIICLILLGHITSKLCGLY